MLGHQDGDNITCTFQGAKLICNGTIYVEEEEPLNYTDKWFWIYLGIYVLLILIAGIVSGLTMGLLSLDSMSLNILKNGGKPREKKYATKIIPVIKRHHLLLVSLLLTNSAAVESMPLFLDRISDPITAVVVSVTAVLIFGEVLPQAICTRFGLAIGATMAPVVKALMFLTLPISWPLAKVLDLLLGKDHCTFFRRAELSVLVDLNQVGDEEEDGLSNDEILIISGALSMREKLAKQASTPIRKIFSIDINGIMDKQTMEKILNAGHARIPVHEAEKSNLLGILYVKNLIKLETRQCIPIRTIFEKYGAELPEVSEDEHLYNLLNQFQNGKSHMCSVVRASGNITEITGIITLEDVVSELLKKELLDVDDYKAMRRISIAQAQFTRRLSMYRASISEQGEFAGSPTPKRRPPIINEIIEEEADENTPLIP